MAKIVYAYDLKPRELERVEGLLVGNVIEDVEEVPSVWFRVKVVGFRFLGSDGVTQTNRHTNRHTNVPTWNNTHTIHLFRV